MLNHRRSTPRDLDLAILRLVAKHEGPIGQGNLNLLLRRQGLLLSTPTVGRKLQELEFDGVLRKVGVDGRVITERGLNKLRQWDAEARLRGSGEALLATLQRGDKKDILDLLSARRVIECEAAALAAEHAPPKSIRRMEELLERQAASIEAGGLGVEEDVHFHQEIARASGNTVLHSLVCLLRNHQRYNFLITSMRTLVGTRLVVDHSAILEGIRARDAGEARQAMERHLWKLSQDLNQYWNRRVRVRTAN